MPERRTERRRRTDRPCRRGGWQRSSLSLQPLDFFADAFALLRILRVFERFAIACHSAIDPTGFLIGIAKMFDNRRVVYRQFYGTFELLDGAWVVPLLIVNPAQAVDVKTVVGRDLE